jgi:predicted small lipoprotein YifL
MKHTFRFLLPAVALVLLLGGCATARQGPLPPAESAATVRVENQSFSDVRIFAIADGRRVRLGTVTGSRTASLRIPPALVAAGRELAFEANPVGSRAAATSFRIWVDPGDEVGLTIPPQIR